MRQSVRTYVLPGVFAPILSLDTLLAETDSDGSSAFDIPDENGRPDLLLEQAEGVAAVQCFVDNLPDRDREIVKRLFWNGETQTQIAASFGVSKMTVSKAFTRICKRGREALSDHKDFALNS